VAVAVDSINVYWGSPMLLAQQALGGGPITNVDFNGAISIAEDAANLYWITNFTDGVSQAPKTGGADGERPAAHLVTRSAGRRSASRYP